MFKRILLPVDGSLAMTPLVRRCLAFAADSGASVIAVHVVTLAGATGAAGAAAVGGRSDVMREHATVHAGAGGVPVPCPDAVSVHGDAASTGAVAATATGAVDAAKSARARVGASDPGTAAVGGDRTAAGAVGIASAVDHAAADDAAGADAADAADLIAIADLTAATDVAADSRATAASAGASPVAASPGASGGAPHPPGQGPPDAVLAHAARILQQVAEQAREAGVPCNVRVLAGVQPWQAIVQAAIDAQADLICMGAHGRHGLAEQVLASQTVRVLEHGRVPVLLFH